MATRPKFREIVSTISYLKPKTNKKPATELRQHNSLLKPGKNFYSKAIGIKTGFHSKAMNTLVAAAEHEGRTLIAVLFGCANRSDRYVDATRLFEAAFAEKIESKKFFGSEKIFMREIAGAKTLVKAALREELAISYYPAEEPICKAFVQWDQVPLPILKGQKVGEVHVCNEAGSILRKGDLLAKEEVKGTLLFILKDWFSRIFR